VSLASQTTNQLAGALAALQASARRPFTMNQYTSMEEKLVPTKKVLFRIGVLPEEVRSLIYSQLEPKSLVGFLQRNSQYYSEITNDHRCQGALYAGTLAWLGKNSAWLEAIVIERLMKRLDFSMTSSSSIPH
jgi:hypothetical protein